MTRIYKMHGQTTKLIFSKLWGSLIIDCGSFWLKHSFTKNNYHWGCYDENGIFITLQQITRQEFIRGMKNILKNVKRIINL
jgi:hypothetical protein